MSVKFKDKLRRLRNARKLTLEELAAGIGSSKAYVWQLENKDNAKPSAEILLKIANFLGESPDFFLDDAVDEPTSDQVTDAFFRKFKRLSDEDRRYIDRIVSGLERDNKD